MNTVLIVEDEKMIRQGLRSMIHRSGVAVEVIMECGNGEMALEILRQQQVDVLFTDIRMPRMDGIELVRKVQELPVKPLIVAISGYDDFSYAVEMLRMGVQEYLLKPVGREKVREVLQKLERLLLERRAQEQEQRNLGCRQLRYFMLSDRVTDEELARDAGRFEELLPAGGYFVCCFVRQPQPPAVAGTENFLYLPDVGPQDVCIVAREYREYFLRNELQEEYTGISGLKQGAGGLRAGWREAALARKFAFCRRQFSVSYDSLTAEERQSAGQKTQSEDRAMEQVVHQIGTDKLQDALRTLEQLTERVKKGKCAPAAFEQKIEQLVDTALMTYRSAVEAGKGEALLLKEPYRFGDVEEYMQELTGWLLGLHETISTEFEDYSNRQKMKQAVEYIQQNYRTDLNMAVVSNDVSMNYSLFSYAFKQYTGTNFVNYLKELRMKEARRLLAETQLKVVEISRQVGYENEKHFMKQFKAVCGVSPSEYRKNKKLS